MALANVNTKTFTWITGGQPEITSTSAAYNNNTLSEDGKTGFIGLNTATGSWMYKIDIATAKASLGLTVEGGKITAITKVEY
ncbi:hypothetical protein [Chitinophaga sp. OAE865]|uniref:hypothetical protein n=1 Tax=Chitinophaga sp. OAE865 TaxID=2817898 RepID=UPI001AE41585